MVAIKQKKIDAELDATIEALDAALTDEVRSAPAALILYGDGTVRSQFQECRAIAVVADRIDLGGWVLVTYIDAGDGTPAETALLDFHNRTTAVRVARAWVRKAWTDVAELDSTIADPSLPSRLVEEIRKARKVASHRPLVCG